MATHSSLLAWRIPGTGKPGGLWGRTESDTTEATLQQQQHFSLLTYFRSSQAFAAAPAFLWL